jgi:hypothetical protein
MTAPTIKRLSDTITGCVRYRLEGGDLHEDWQKSLRPGESIWCEVSIWFDGDHIGSYGGTVWPLAWPAWFEGLPSSAQLGSGRVRLTAAGRAAFDGADPARRKRWAWTQRCGSTGESSEVLLSDGEKRGIEAQSSFRGWAADEIRELIPRAVA